MSSVSVTFEQPWHVIDVNVLPPSEDISIAPAQALIDGLCTRTPKSVPRHWSTTTEFFGHDWPVVTLVYPLPLSTCTSSVPSLLFPLPVVIRSSVPAHGGGAAGGVGGVGGCDGDQGHDVDDVPQPPGKPMV